MRSHVRTWTRTGACRTLKLKEYLSEETTEIMSFCQWKYHESLEDQGTQITGQWREYIQNDLDTSVEYPACWARHPLPSQYQPQGHSTWIFKHQSDAKSQFWYLIPVSDSEDGPQPRSNVFARYLSCRTQRVWLECEYLHESPRFFYSVVPTCLSLKDKNVKIVGELNLLLSEFDGSSSSAGNIKLTQPLEHVAISNSVLPRTIILADSGLQLG